MLDILVQSRRNKQAAKKFFRKLLKGCQYVPRVIITDKLKSYGAAKREILPGVEHRQSRYLNNRCENSHRPTRQREYRMQGFTSPGMPSGFCRHMAPLPNTFARDGICCQPPTIVKRCGIDSRVGPKSRVRSGPPKRRIGGNRTRKVLSAAWSQYHPQQLDNAAYTPRCLRARLRIMSSCYSYRKILISTPLRRKVLSGGVVSSV